MTKLSAHFTLAEATKSQEAERKAIDNTPPADVIARMKAVAENILEPVRAHFGKPVVINSFYRSPAVNMAIGAKPGSQHTTGEAVDFEVPGVDNAVVAAWIRDTLVFDQLILEFYTPGQPSSGWVHCSYKAGPGCRAECLTINAAGTQFGLVA
jgi:zinc D-Ala-D-Ala carboxypeptidase